MQVLGRNFVILKMNGNNDERERKSCHQQTSKAGSSSGYSCIICTMCIYWMLIGNMWKDGTLCSQTL